MSRVGVVILTHNRADEVTATLARMVALPDRPQLVVVDNGSTDHTAACLSQRFPDVAVVRLAENAGAAGRNAGVAQLDTPYVAFCDDDTWWAPGSLDRAADLLDAHPSVGLVCGRVLVGTANAPDPACAAMASSPLPRQRDVPGRPVLGFMCAASIVRRHAFVDAGGFEPRFFIGGEEELLAVDLAAAGWVLTYVPDIVVHHHPSRQRDSTRRRQLVVRNALWCAWLRRPWPSAARRSIAVLRVRARGRAASALIEALCGLRWVLRHRRVVPPGVEAALRILEDGSYAVRRRMMRRPDTGGAAGAWDEAPGSSSRFAR